jgi:hypothetical protein
MTVYSLMPMTWMKMKRRPTTLKNKGFLGENKGKGLAKTGNFQWKGG